MPKTSHNDTSEFVYIELPRQAVFHIRRNHEAAELTVGIRSYDHSRDVHMTICPSHCFGLGASVTLDDGAEEPLTAALYLGPVTLYFGARGSYGRRNKAHPDICAEKPGLLRRAVAALTGKHKRRKVSAVVDRFDDHTIEGPSVRARLTLWDDDARWEVGRARQWSIDVSRLLWGKPVCAAEQVLEERMVTVAMPECLYEMQARLLLRAVSWPRWPLNRLNYGVRFSPACMLVPRRKSDGLAFEGDRPGCEFRVDGASIRAGVANLIDRVLRDREAYGGPNWTPQPTPLYKDSHNLALSWVTRPEDAAVHAVCDRLLHGQVMWVISGNSLRQISVDYTVTGLLIGFRRGPFDGGVYVYRFADSPVVFVDGEPVAISARVWPDSLVQIGCVELIARYSPVGPAPSAVQLPLVETAQPDEDAQADVTEVARSLDTSAPGPDEIDNLPSFVRVSSTRGPL